MSLPGHSSGEFTPSAEMQPVYFTVPDDWLDETDIYDFFRKNQKHHDSCTIEIKLNKEEHYRICNGFAVTLF